MTWKERILLFLLAAINFTNILDFMIMMPLGNFLMPHFSISPKYFSIIVAAYPITAFFSSIVAAFYVDRYDRKKVLLFAYIGFLVGTLCCGIAADAFFLMMARILTGLFGGLIGAQVLSIIADVFPYEKRGRAMSSIFMAFAAASVFGVPFSLYLAGLFSWHAPFIFIGVLGWVFVPMIIRFLPSIKHHVDPNYKPDSIRTVFNQILGNRSQVIALLLSGLLMFGHFMLIPFINPYLEFNKGFTKNQTPMVYMVGGVCSLLASFIIGRVSDQYGKFNVFLVAVICSLFPILFITNMPDLPIYIVLSVFGFWFAASTSRSIPAQAMISTVVEPGQRGRFMSFNSSFQQLFTGMASLVSGLIVSKAADGKILHYNRVGYLSALVVASTIYLGFKLAKRQQLN
jgi:MFS transporter, DHA1 family, inner membrane transport protein